MKSLYYKSPLIIIAWLGTILNVNAQCTVTTPIVNVSPSTTVCGQTTVTFSVDPSTIDPNTTYFWDFDDSGAVSDTATGTTVTHTFSSNASGGTHNVTVSAVPNAGVPQPVNWTNLVNTTVNGTSLTKNSNAFSYNAGASSTQTIGEGQYVGFVANPNVTVAVGLSSSDPSTALNSIEYGIVANGFNDLIEIHESSSSFLGQFGTFVAGDTLGVGVLNGNIVYYHNGNIVYTSTVTPTLPLIVDASIPHANASIDGAFVVGQYCVAFGNTTITTTPTPNFTIGSSGFDRQQTCKTIINPGDQLGVIFGFSSGYDGSGTTTYTIDYGDGGGAVPLAGNVTSYTYTSPGLYIVTVTGSANGCTSTFSDTIFYLDRPLADMSIVGSADVCEGDTVFTLNNTDTVNNRVTYYVWEWDDGTLDTVYYQGSASHVFSLGDNLACADVPGGGMPYDITLYAFNECFQHTNSSPVTVSQTPTGDLTSVAVECNSVASTSGIAFSLDYCTYGIAGTPSWNFDDTASGALDTLAFPPDNPTHIFVGGPGLYDVTVNISTLCGEYNDTARVHILQEPSADANFTTNGQGLLANGDGCNPVELYFNNSSTGDSLVYDWTITPSGGTSFINGTSNTSASPQISFNTAGEFIVEMTATNPCGVSTWSDTIVVLDGPAITLNPPTPTCDSFSYTPTITYFDGGGVINTYAWEFFKIDGSPNGSLLATSNQPFPTYNFTSPGDYKAVIRITNDCTTQSDSITFTIEATPGPITINAGIPIETCVGEAPFTITADSVGGTWSGPGINASGVFDPSSVVPGTYTVYYNYDVGNGCPADVPVDVTVHALPTVNAGNNINVCVNDDAFDITGFSPAGGTWSGTGIIDQTNGTFDPATAGVGLHTVTYTYTDGNSCENSDELVVNVSGLPTVSAQADETYCDVDYDIQLNVGTPVGGTWSGPGALYNNQGYFNIDSAGGLGTYTLYYNYVDANGCENLDSTDITVINNIVASAGVPDTLCLNSGTYTLNNFTPTGGIWTGNGMIGQGPDFSPSAAGVGTHPLIYTVGSGTCSDKDTVAFVVEAITIVNAGNDTLVCAGTDALTLSPSPMGGTWSGPGITDANAGIFDPETSGTGTFFLTYSYTNPVTDCISSDVITVTVAPLPTVNAGGTFIMCDTAASFPITGYSPLGGLWSGPGITDPANAMFNPSLAGGLGYNGQDTTHTLYYAYIDGNGCESMDSLLMTVTYGDTLTLEKARDTVCINSGIYTITGFSPAGGSWSGPGIIGTSPNFSPQAAGIGVHDLIYKYGTGSCTKQIIMQIQVDAIPTVDAGNNVLVCANDPVYTLSGHSPLGGVWTGTGIIDGTAGTFNPSIATGTYSLTYTYTDPVTGCEDSDTRLITISPLPVVTVASNVTECYVPTDIALTNYNPAGGVWSGPGIVDANGGIFNGDTAGGIGIYDLVYTYTDGNGCMNTDTTEMELIGVIVADAGPGDTVCVYDNPITLNGFSPSGGTWTGTGITNGTTGEFDPGQVSAGTYTLTYTVGSGTCEDSDQTTVLVGGVPNVDAKADESVCVSAAPFNLTTATPANGYWSGNGIIDSIAGTFDPALVGDGTHVLTYTYINPITGCEGSDNKNVVVYPLPNVNAGDTVAYCNTPSNVQLTGFTPTSGGIWSGQGIVDANNGVFNPITAGDVGTYPVVLTFTDGNNCTNNDTLYINVVAGDTVNAGPNDTLCIDDVAINLSGYPTGGIWSGAGITNTMGVFDPSQVSAGFHYPVYTVGTGTCERKDTIEVFVSALPSVDAGNNLEYCIDAGVVTMTGQSPSGGYWMGTGIIDSLAGTFDPTIAGVGSHTVSYVVTNTFGCDNIDTRTIIINNLPTVNAGDTVAYCFTPDNIQLTGFTPASGGTWSGTGIIDANNGVFNANAAGATGIGFYDDIVLSYTDGNNCTNTDTLAIVIEFGDTINAGSDLAMCIDDDLDTLTGYIPTNGGTWSGTGIISSSGVFDPGTAGGGTHQLVYTFGSGTCLKRDTIEVLVGTIPTVNAGTNQAVCIDEPTFNMTGFSPSNGVWTGQGITDATLGTFNANTAGVGTHTLTYTYTNPITGCENFDTKQIIVHDLPNVNAGDTVEYCNTPNNITLTGYSPLGGNWSGAGVIDNINGIFNTVNAGGEGTYYPVYTYTDGNGCTNFDTLVVEVIYGDTVDAGDPIGMCITDGVDTLDNGYRPSTGGTWSGPGITNSSLGIFDPSLVQTNTLHRIYYTYGVGTCEKTDSTTIFVGTTPFVEAGVNDTICELDGILTLSGFVPSAGGVWTGTGVVPGTNTFDPSVSGAGTFTLTYYYEVAFTGCDNFDTKTVTVVPAPTVNAGNGAIVCNSANDITLTGFNPLGGVWTGPGITNPSGVFNTIIAGGLGVNNADTSYTLTYTYTDGTGCSNTDTVIYDVIFGDDVSAGADTNICIDGGALVLSGTPVGGTWSGNGIINTSGVFDPSVSGTGTHVLTYTYGTGTCQKTDQMQVIVSPALTINAGPDVTVCEADAAFTLTGNVPSTGGTWSGTGITDATNGIFDPSVAGVGTHTITYSFTNTNTNCSDTDTRIVTVSPPPTVFAGNDQTYCNSGQIITLSGNSPSGGTWSGSGIIDPILGEFNSQLAGGIGYNNADTVYQVVYTYSTGSCLDRDTVDITIIFGDTVIAGIDEAVCIDDVAFNLTGFSPSDGTGTWSGNGILDPFLGLFDPATAGVGTHTLTYTYGTGTCQKTDTKTVQVYALPTVNAGTNLSVCINDLAFTLSGYSPLGGTWAGTGITDATTGIFDPATAGVGTFTLTYNYVHPITGCESSDTRVVTVNDLPVISMPDTTEFCQIPSNILLSDYVAYAPIGGTWSGPGIVDAANGIFNSTQSGASGIGTYQVFYSYTDGNGCTNTEDLIIDVIFGDTVVAGPSVTLCIDNGPHTLAGFSPSGGMYSGTGIIDGILGVFDPVTAGVGTHTISYTFGTGTCEKTVTSTVTVAPLPVVSAGTNQTVCINNAIFNLGGYSPTGGTWSGNGITDATLGTFDPATAGVGVHTLTYEYTDGNGCYNADTKTITVNDLPVVAMPDTTVFCQIPSNILLSDYIAYSPTGGVWSGNGIVDVNNGIFNSTQAGANGIGTYQVFYAYTDPNGCTNTEDLIIDVIFGDTVFAGPNVTICIDNGLDTLAGFSPIGGTYSGTGIVNNTQGVFDPTVAGVGTHTISYTFGTGTCEKTVTSTVTVTPLPVVNAGTNQTVCVNNAIFNLGGYSPTGGTWSGNGITDATLGTFDPATAGVGVHTLTYEYTDGNGCYNSDTKTITVNDLPVVAMPDTTVFCQIPSNILLSDYISYSPAGGVWSGNGIVDVNNGIFNSTQAGASGIGTYQVFYSYTDPNGCTNTEDLIIDVIFGDTVLAGPNVTICIDNGLDTLLGFSPIGGTFSGTGIVNNTQGVFDPTIAGVGTHTISYTFGTGTCEKTVTSTVTVTPLPVVNAGINQTVCVNNAIFNLGGYSPLGGTWSGNGITDATLGTFDPATAGVGTHTLTYEYTDGNGCYNSDTKTIVVNDLPIITIADTVEYCVIPTNITLSGYSPTGGTWSGPGIVDATNGLFNSTQAGANGIGIYQVFYTYTDGNGCTNSEDLIIDIIFGDTVVAGPNVNICIDNGLYNLTGFSPAGGTYTGTGVVDATNGIFDPTIAGVGTHTISYTFGTGTCEKIVSATITVEPLPVVNAGVDESVCVNESTFLLSGQSPTGGTWSGTGITDATAGLFDPATAGVGSHNLTYTYTNPSTGCTDSDVKVVTVNALPIVSVQDTTTICLNVNNYTLTGYTPFGGTWTGAGIVDNNNGIFNAISAGGVGTYTLTYTYVDGNGCEVSDQMVIVVEPSIAVAAGNDIATCIDNGNVQLTGFSPAGGTWTGAGIIDPVNGVFDPQIAGAGNTILTYSVGSGTCLVSDDINVFVGTAPNVSAGVDQTVCFTDAAFSLLGASPPNGVWTGIGITDPTGVFDPAVSGTGTFTLTYTYVNNVTGCENFNTKEVTVLPPPTVFAGDTAIYCNTNQNITLTNYTPTGGLWSGSGVVDNQNGVFNPNVAGGEGIYHLVYDYTNAIGCSNDDTLVVEIIFGDTVYAGLPDTVCIDDAAFTFVNFTPVGGGTWSGNGVVDANAGVFDPATAGVGTHVISYTFGDSASYCRKTSTKTVFVGALPTISLGMNDTVCIDASAFNIIGYSPQGGTWAGVGITDGTLGTFDPAVAGIGTHTVSYTFVNSVTNCDRTVTKQIIVKPLPNVFVTNSVTYCNTSNDITLTGFSPSGGVWTGAGIVASSGVFNSSIAGGLGYNGADTTYILTYTFTDNFGCENSADMTVNIIFGDTVQAGPNINVCIDESPIVLGGQLPASGGTWSGNGITDPIVGIFDPATAGVGSHTITWTFGTGTCEKTSTRTVTVSNPPNISAGVDEVVCINDAAFLLSSYSPTGGTWSGTGITDTVAGIFDPAVSGVGTFTLTYYYFNTATNCDAFDTKIVTVAPLPTVNVASSVTYCENPNNIILTGNSPQGGFWSGPGVLDGFAGIFNTGQAGGLGVNGADTSYVVTYTYTDGNGCENSADMTINVIFGDTVEAGPNIAVCTDDGLITLTGQLPVNGGTWSGTGIIDAVAGIFDPAAAGVGTHTVTWTYGTGTCEKTSTRTVTVSNPPIVNAGINQTICIDNAPILLGGNSPTGGVWSGAGITDTIAGVFDPSVAGVGTFTLTYYYYNASTNCDAFDTKTITVVPLPTVTTAGSVTYCENPNNITLTGYSPTGGTWSGVGIVNGSAGVFSTVQAGGLGVNGGDTSYLVTYTFVDGNGCENSADMTINVIFGDTVEAGPNIAVCTDDGQITLTGQLPANGGTWSGTGIIDPVAGIFDPITAGIGTHTVTWTYGTGTCEKISTRTITVSNPPIVSAGTNQTICIDNAPLLLTGSSPTGGVWSGVGVTDTIAGIFDPSVAGVGTFTLTYYYYNASTNCDASATKTITVAPLPTVTTASSVTYCDNPNNITLTGYSPTGGTWSGAGIVNGSAGVFSTVQAGGLGVNGGDTSYLVTYTFVDGNGCENSADMTINVIFGDTVEAGPNIAVCTDDGQITLTGQLPVNGGTWSGTGIIDPVAGIFDPITAGTGTHTVTWTYGTGTCEKTSTRTITVSDPPIVTAGANQMICIDNAPFLLAGNSPTGGVWSGVGITDTVAGIFDPSVAGIGTFTLTYYYYNASTNCDASATKIITIAPLPSVSTTSSVTYCDNPNNITLTGYSPQGGIWTGPGIINGNAGIFNTFQAGGLGVNNGDTTHTLTYTVTDGNGCQNTSDMTVNLIFGDTVEAGPNITVCVDEGLITLTDQTPLGGTWSSSSAGVDPSGIFDPQAAGVGTHTLTYTYGSGTCEKTSVRTITVGAVPTVNAGVDLTICEGDVAFILGGNTPVGGTWSGIGITDSLAGLFDPTVAGVGTFTITYAFANSATGCEGVDTRTITINPLPIVTTEDSTTYCFTGNNIQLTGFTPTSGGQWSGAGVVNPNTGVFNPGQTPGLGYNNGDTTYVLTYSFTDGNGCTDTEILEVTLTEGDTVEAGPNIALCVTDAAFNLTGNIPATGGTWSGPGITDPVAGTFDPASAGTGTHTVTWEFGTGTCLKTSTRTITVGSPPIVTAGLDEFMCVDQGQVLLGGYSPVGGIWNGSGIVDSIAGLFDVDSAGVGQHTISYYVVNNITGCENIDYKTITVGDLPVVQVTDSVLFCDNSSNILLTDYISVTPAGGIWSGPGVVDPVDGIFNTTIAGGLTATGGDTTYNLIYTYAAGNSCEAEDTLAITITFGDTIVSGPNDTLCLGDNPITFTGFSPAGGTWSGIGIINTNTGEFDPNASGVGLHTLTYTYGSGTCEKQVTKTVLVDAPPTISIGPDQTVCIDATPFTLGGYSPQGGIWSGVGITDSIVGTFSPAAANVGTHTLTYEFVNSVSGCSNTDTRDITVVPLPVVTAGDTLLFCDNPNNVTLGDYVNYNPPGGNWSGAGIVDPTNGIFNTNSAGGLGYNGLDTSYTVTYGYTDGNGCFADDDLVINVTYGDTVVAGPNEALCIDQGLYQLQGFSPFGGLWSGLTSNANNAIVDAVNGIFDPQVAGPGPHTLIYTYGQGTCQKQDTRVIFIGTPPVVNAGADQTLCIDVPAFTLGGFSPAGGVWTGPGILDSLTGVFDPVTAGVGTHTLFYRVSNLITGCETINSKQITINPLPIVYAGDTLEVCNNPNDIILTGYSPAGGVWSGSGIVDATGGVFNTNVAGGLGYNGADTIYPVIYNFTDANVCSNKDTLLISVIYGDTVLAGPNDSVCIDATPFTLGGSPLGGTWSGVGVNAGNGTFNPLIAGAGSHVVTYTYGSGTCEKTDQKIVYVGTPIPVDAGVDQFVCEDATQLFLSGQNVADGVWSGAGVVDGVTGEFNPQLVGVGFHTVVYTYTDPVTGCVSFDTKEVEVKPLPNVNAGGTVTYCNWPLDIQLTNYSPTGTGGIWTGVGIINGTQGTFNASIAGGLGYNGADTIYPVTYTFTDQFGCVNSDDLDINITYGDTVYAGPDITVCIDGGNVQLLGNYPAGGYFSGTGVDSFGVFNPMLTGGGVHEIVYTQGVETCVKSDTLEVTVVDLTGTTAGPDENTCLESGPIMLSGNSPLGGVWTGSGIIDNNLGIFEPLAANADTVFITYTYTDTVSGCQYSDTKMVTRNPLPNIDFIFSSDTLCIGDTLSFTNTSDANVNVFKWFFGDGDSSIFFQPTHIYNAAGTYQVMLIGVSPEGCPDTTVQDVVIYELPTPSFTMNVDNGCGPLPVNFTNTSVGQDVEYLWNFGNGQTSTLASPGVITFQQGVFDTLYVVTLDVTNRCGTVSFTDTVFVQATPTAIMGADNLSGCTPLPVNFTNFSTGNATSYLWDFGNGNISTDSIPATQFFTTVDTITTYTVTLTASNACGSDSETIDITVDPGSVNAFFTPDTTIGCQPLTVNFTSLASANSTVSWDFGDGNTLAGPAANAGVITHTFDTSGVFTVTQYVSNYCGIDTFDAQITVHPAPEVSMVHASFACVDAPFQFTNTSPQQLAGVTWDFGDGTTSNQLNPQHVYTTPGIYTVTFTGYSLGFACPADTQTTVQVFGKPNAHFTPSANSSCAPLDVTFVNNSGTGAMFYSWDFGDGNVSNLQNPTHQFTNTGNYTVTLTVADANGCTDDTTMVNFIVFPSPTSAFVPDANQQCGLNDYVELTNTSQGATQYYWDFGNGQFSTLTDPVINYNQLGDYTITLITQNQYNCTDTTQTLYSVLPGPEADFEIESQNGCEPLTVQFTQTSTNSTLFYWYFGDGDSAAVANPIHTYTDGGTYDVTMVASLDNQCFDTFYIPGAVYVDQAPTASFTMEEVGDATGTYNFVNSSVGATSYFWDFGDGSTSTDENPQHRYDYNGLRQVMLIAISATGCSDTMIIELEPTFFKGLYVPNAFSPRVGIGDVREFRPVGVGLEEYRVEVFSQWGELLWSSEVLDENGVPVEGWDGMYNGRLMPQGAYVWKVHAIFQDGSNWEGMPDASGVVRKIGSVTLLD